MKYNLSDMMCLDVYLTDATYEKVRQEIKPANTKPIPLLTWDIFMESYLERLTEVKRRTEMGQVLSLAKKFNWKNNLEPLFENSDYEALVVTDLNQKIIWVNEGFTTMTGYSKKFALDKTPVFLQGAETSAETKSRIRDKIAQNKPFKETIVNYKRDKTTYNCEVKIIPLYNDQTTHFIAFEKQVI